ncbi:MAG: CHASE3 domain-containing protein [Rhizomicrobium sp.]
MAAETSFWKTICHHIRCGHLRPAGTEMVAAAMVLLLSGMLLMGANMSALHRLGLATEHSYQALLKISEVDSNILASELSMRSFAATGETEFIWRHGTRIQSVETALTDLSALLAEYPEDVTVLQRLRVFADGRKKMFADLIVFKPTRAHPATDIVMDARVRQARMDTGKMLSVMRAQELKRVVARQQASERKARQTFILSSGVVIVSFGLGLLGLFFSGTIGTKSQTDDTENVTPVYYRGGFRGVGGGASRS